MDKKICVVSMSVGKPASMTAAWINNELIMAERTSYPERRRDMELQLLRELREKRGKGFYRAGGRGKQLYYWSSWPACKVARSLHERQAGTN